MENHICIIGANKKGSSKVVLDIIKQSTSIKSIEFFDDDELLKGSFIENYQVVGSTKILTGEKFSGSYFTLAFGNNLGRKDIFEKLVGYGMKPINLIHPSAVVASNVKLGSAIWIAANAVVNPGAEIGDGVVINTSATIDHDCFIESFSNISPGCHLSGRTRIGSFVFLGTGVITLPDTIIGEKSIIGAGSVVTKRIPPNVTAVGIPARIIKRNNVDAE